ncbi:RNA editing 3' terminal uridylyl transferase 1 [Leptomonas seymouri]|uniref:RNA uridylyltransferase n=1 Tax=Leptomonas seymouri TaxID=5684 RepID=A0A0N1HW47_LEPSE|nr:RNA editing 3' terminal uridylyl transferase 1 [Leptomonas seymouri]|eukprot:KPI84990.1 RNA editing 3' terminal uridylyl transferase 1 [Leptomonas seymouri]
MTKYVALFNSQGASSGAAAAASSSAETSPPLSSSTVSTSAAAAATNSAGSSPSNFSPPRSRLVRRRRDGEASSDGPPVSTAAAHSSSKEDKRNLFDSKRGTLQGCLFSPPSTAAVAAAVETGVAAPAAPPLHTGLPQRTSRPVSLEPTKEVAAREEGSKMQETESGHDGDVGDGSSEAIHRQASDTSDTFEDAEDGGEEPPLAGSSCATDAAAASSSSASVFTHQSEGLFTCDACMHYVASSYRNLERHALEQHGDALADYTRLRTVSEKLVPMWSQVLERKRNVIQKLGEEVFRVAAQRDAGVAKMAEAHRARAQLELVVQRWHPNARVFIFGSSVAFGVWDGMSDIDFTVVDVDELEAGVWPPSEKNAVRTITELLRRAGFSFINLEPISHARVPIIKHHASLPIRLTDEQRRRLRKAAREAAAEAENSRTASAPSSSSSASALLPPSPSSSAVIEEDEENTQLEAELVIARSVRYTLNLPASPLDSAVLEASIRVAVGSAAVQQVWWNRSREMCCVTFDSTTNAVKAATCPLHFISSGMRARVQPLHEECRPELYGMDFDLSFRAFGIRNSHLLRRYLLSHPCARPGALVLKDWSKSSGVNNSVNGYLTSYAINIMWIYYLVHHGVIPYVSPTKDIPESLRGNVSGDPEYAAIVDPAWTEAQRVAMQTQAGELLIGFFYYYAFDFDWEHHVVSLNRPGVTTKAMLGWDVEDVAVTMNGAGQVDGAMHGGLAPPGHQQQQYDLGSAGGGATATRRSRMTTRYSFCIEDPYEENLNLGRHMGVTKTLRVQTELYRGLLSLLKDDVNRCCVFAGTSSAEEKNSEGGSDGGSGADEASMSKGKTEPVELPLRVLYRLMAIATREMAIAKAAHAAGTSTGTSNAKNSEFAGIPLAHLTASFEARAPAEWSVACNAWNVHQLLHRLGLKLHGGAHVLPRREVGVRRMTSQASPGVIPATAPEPTAVSASSTSLSSSDLAAAALMPNKAAALPQNTAQLAEMNHCLLRPVRASHLPIDLMMAITRGYECLTPEWVAWSKPWAALSAWWTDQRQALPVSSTTENNHANGGGDRISSSLVTPMVGGAAAADASPHQRVPALPEQAVGAMHQTRKQLYRLDPLQGLRKCATTDVLCAHSSGRSKRYISGAVGRPPARVSAIAALSLSSLSFRSVWRVFFR